LVQQSRNDCLLFAESQEKKMEQETQDNKTTKEGIETGVDSREVCRLGGDVA
jgi:hypothetical protein